MSDEMRDAGYRDGYRVGPDRRGNPAGGHNEDLFDDPCYRRGLSEGRSDRIGEDTRAVTGGRA